MDNSRNFLSENFHLLVVKFSVYLIRHDFVMNREGHWMFWLIWNFAVLTAYQALHFSLNKYNRIVWRTENELANPNSLFLYFSADQHLNFRLNVYNTIVWCREKASKCAGWSGHSLFSLLTRNFIHVSGSINTEEKTDVLSRLVNVLADLDIRCSHCWSAT